jgi:hypothetical protein
MNQVDAIILNVPRIAPNRPSSGTALIKTLLNNLNISNQVYDINLDFFNCFVEKYDSKQFHELDLYFYSDEPTLTQDTYENYNKFIDNWVNKIIAHQPKWILISVFTWQCQKFTKDFLQKLRPCYQGNIVIGGQGMIKSEQTSFNERPVFAIEMLEQQLIDYYIQGEAEIALTELLKGNTHFLGINSNQYAPRSEMPEVPFCDFSDHAITDYHSGYNTGELPLETSRGCVRSCVFCDWPVYAGGFRSKPGRQLFEETIEYYTRYSVKNFYFNDSLMNGNMNDFRAFNQHLVDYYVGNNMPMRSVRYSGMYIVRKPNQMTEQDYKLISDAGADTLLIGVETGSDRIRKEMKKGFNNQDLDFTVQMCSKYGIRLYFLMIVGFPSETREDFEQTLDLLRKYQRYVADGTLTGINFGTTLSIGEGTPMYNNYEQFNITGVNGNRPNDVFWIHKENPELTYKERIMRRIEVQELATELGYTFWKGDDQLTFLQDKYKLLLNEYQNFP